MKTWEQQASYRAASDRQPLPRRWGTGSALFSTPLPKAHLPAWLSLYSLLVPCLAQIQLHKCLLDKCKKEMPSLTSFPPMFLPTRSIPFCFLISEMSCCIFKLQPDFGHTTTGERVAYLSLILFPPVRHLNYMQGQTSRTHGTLLPFNSQSSLFKASVNRS